MHFDSQAYIKFNPLLQDGSTFPYPKNLKDFFQLPARYGVDSDLAANIATRPLSYATFHWNWSFDGDNPHWYRVVNIAIHIANSMLVYALALTVLARHSSRWFIAITASLLFAAHPLAIESVTYIVQRVTSLMVMFYLSAIWLHLLANDILEKRLRWGTRAASVICLLCAMLSKESSVTAPLMAMLLDWARTGFTWPKIVRRALPLLLCLPVVPILVLAAAGAQNDGGPDIFTALNLANAKVQPVSHTDYAISELTVLFGYLSSLLWPSALNLDPTWPLYHSLMNWQVLSALLAIVFLLGGAWRLHQRQWLGANSTIIFAFLVWFIGTFVVSSGLAPLPDLMAEHRSYLPSVGFFIVLACLFEALRCRLGGKFWARRLIPSFVLAIVVALSVVNWRRNDVWSSDVRLWEDTVAKSPGKARAWGNLGVAYFNENKFNEALICCDKAITLEPRYLSASFLKALLLIRQGQAQSQKAVVMLMQLAKVYPEARSSIEFQYTVGVALLGMGRLDEGADILSQIVKDVPTHWKSYYALGLAYRQKRQWSEALSCLRSALELCPGNGNIESIIANVEKDENLRN